MRCVELVGIGLLGGVAHRGVGTACTQECGQACAGAIGRRRLCCDIVLRELGSVTRLWAACCLKLSPVSGRAVRDRCFGPGQCKELADWGALVFRYIPKHVQWHAADAYGLKSYCISAISS